MKAPMTSKSQITIHAPIRAKLGLTTGTVLVVCEVVLAEIAPTFPTREETLLIP